MAWRTSGAGGLLSGLLGVLRGHDRISMSRGSRGPHACVFPPRVRFAQAGHQADGVKGAAGGTGATRSRAQDACGRARRAWRGPTLSSPAAARPRTRTNPRGKRRHGVCRTIGTREEIRAWPRRAPWEKPAQKPARTEDAQVGHRRELSQCCARAGGPREPPHRDRGRDNPGSGGDRRGAGRLRSGSGVHLSEAIVTTGAASAPSSAPPMALGGFIGRPGERDARPHLQAHRRAARTDGGGGPRARPPAPAPSPPGPASPPTRCSRRGRGSRLRRDRRRGLEALRCTIPGVRQARLA